MKPSASITKLCQVGFLALTICQSGIAQDEPEFNAFSAAAADHTRKDESGFRALYVMDRDGSDVQYLVAAPGQISSATPEWSHNQHYVAFDATSEFQQFALSRIFVYAVEGPMRGVMRDLGHGNVPSWSPDDTKIAFMLNPGNPRGDEGGIWIMNADGTNRQYKCGGWYPRWSPDGTKLAIQCVSKQPSRVQVLDIASGELRDILGEEMEISYSGATWSPDGQRLLFVGRNDDGQHVATVRETGDSESVEILYTEQRPGFTLVGPPVWSPDGKQIVFSLQERHDNPFDNRMWANSHLYTLSPHEPGEPEPLEVPPQGNINRGMWFSPDSERIVFSSER